jgi:hypothetical protein
MNIIITWGQYGLQDGNSPIIEELIFLHDFINLVLMGLPFSVHGFFTHDSHELKLLRIAT